MSDKQATIVEYYGAQDRNRCGYCKGQSGCFTNGMWAYRMTVDDYQMLIDRGWRRSGEYCYKPNMRNTCCPSYAIRCSTKSYVASKSQKDVIKKFNQYLVGTFQEVKDELPSPKLAVEGHLARGDGGGGGGGKGGGGGSGASKTVEGIESKRSRQSNKKSDEHYGASGISIHDATVKYSLAKTGQSDYGDGAQTPQPSTSGVYLRLPKYRDSTATNTGTSGTSRSQGTTLTPEMRAQQTGAIKKILTYQPQTDSDAMSSSEERETIELELKRQVTLVSHKQASAESTESAKTATTNVSPESVKSPTSSSKGPDPTKPRPMKAKLLRRMAYLGKHGTYRIHPQHKQNVSKPIQMLLNDFPDSLKSKLEIILVKSDEASTPIEFELYRKYQIAIHKDDPRKITKSSFEGFLINSPLHYRNGPNGIQYGSFHQQYWLDKKLIAVGVIDILPYCVSSVYFFYDPNLNFLSLGNYGSLREIGFVNELNLKSPDICYYYLGYYIHSCPKMTYKANFQPAYLLCPEVYSWHPITNEIKQKLSQNRYQRLNPDLNAIDENKFTENDLEDILLLSDLQYYERFRSYFLRNNVLDDERYFDYGQLVGKQLASKMFLCKL